MKISIPIWLVSVAVSLFVAGAQAAETDNANVVRDYTDVVMPANQQAYETGVKAYNQCMHEHGFKYKWTALSHVTGNVYVYSYVTDPVEWGDFDTMHATGGACDSVWRSEVNPHLKSETSAFMVVKPELSHMPQGMKLGTGLIGVTYFKLKGGHETHEMFANTLKLIAEAAAKSNWPGRYLFSMVQDAGPDSPDFVLVWPAKNWADFGREVDPPLWKMLEEVYGKKKAGELRKALAETIVTLSSHVDQYNADLTYTASSD